MAASTTRSRRSAERTGPRLDGDRGVSRAARASTTEALLRDAHATDDEDERRALLDGVVLVNRGVAEAVASRYRRRGVPMEDLHQAAYEGLVKAVYRFDPTLGKDLLTYAVPTIRGELQRHFRDHSWTVRPPRRVQELQWRVNRCIEDLTQELGHEPTDGQIQDTMHITPAEYDEAIVAFGCFTPTSLDQPVSHDGAATVGELLPDDAGDVRALDAAEARTALAPVIKELPERDRRIIYLRFFEDQTQEEIGAELGVTQMQVSRLLTRILRDLRSALGTEAA
ncbi:sigma-70 family RNA polymerase sigma factor [Nocardioides sp. BP30]|uniref:sigma-70 family RNA polymerase sigma factor n=1 Tax=Nocardioides sp. BP30 TaxID=3036374 RepID=UPI002468B59A|nr:sigma-70 family RNA polymerase sigma factor [Nocardioides sp. BP30]WGL51122.1 sigma-70 family RNA polymerase sigma factor [Nocardioides sp. BP30]